MGRQNRQVQRRLGAVAGKGMTDALQISPATRSKARTKAFIRSSSSRPKGLLIFERGRVESLSTITCGSKRDRKSTRLNNSHSYASRMPSFDLKKNQTNLQST